MERELKFRAWYKPESKMIEAMDLQHLIHQKESTFPLKVLYEDIVFMQYTGLKDKNGKDIYEWDVVIWSDKERAYICAIYWNINRWVCRMNGEDYWFIFSWEYMEVIGNIFEKKDLRDK